MVQDGSFIILFLKSSFKINGCVKKMMSNQGLYNGFLASGLMWSLTETGEFQFQIAIFFLICIVCAAIYGSETVSKKIFLLQGIPALLAITSLLLPLLFW